MRGEALKGVWFHEKLGRSPSHSFDLASYDAESLYEVINETKGPDHFRVGRRDDAKVVKIVDHQRNILNMLELGLVLDAVKKSVLQLSVADLKELAAGSDSTRSHISSVGQSYLLSAVKIIDGRQKVCIGTCKKVIRKDSRRANMAISPLQEISLRRCCVDASPSAKGGMRCAVSSMQGDKLHCHA